MGVLQLLQLLLLWAALTSASPFRANDGTNKTSIMTTPTPSETPPNNPPTISCTFDGGLCGWNQLTSDQKNWSWIQGETDTLRTGPKRDHTTRNGSYIYLETTGGNYNDKAQLESNQVMPNGTNQCFQFWYHMYGNTINTLNVYIREQHTPLSSPIWAEEGNQGYKWILGQIPISITSPYTIVLEALKGTSYSGDIAVDDVSLVDGFCDDTVSCTFDGGLCGWRQLTSDRTDWHFIQGNTATGSTGPTNDHTSGSELQDGKYIYLETSGGHNNYSAQLESKQVIPNTADQCFQFWHHMHGNTINTLNVYIREPNKPLGSPIWTKKGAQGDKWILGQISLSIVFPYTIVLEALRGTGYTGDIAVDDVSLFNGFCDDTISCTFDRGLCEWKQLTSEQKNWVWRKGSTGPTSDHTSGDGGYIYLETYRGANNDIARLESKQVMPNTAHQIVLEALEGTSYTGDIAVDDVSLVDGFCEVSCTFDGGLCGWKQLTSDQQDWIWREANTATGSTGPTNDHTSGNGKYIYLETSAGSTNNDKAQLESNQVMPNEINQCFQFWYHMHGSTINTLNVYIREQNKPLGSPIWTKEREQGDKWILGQISISITSPYTIVLEALRGTGYTGDIAVDDVSMVDGICDATISCTFDGGLCGWKQLSSNQIKWYLRNGNTPSSSTGPTNDHTSGNGRYIYLETNNGDNNDSARLESQQVMPNTAHQCFQFWYHMHGSTINALNVYTREQNKPLGSPIFTMKGPQGDRWILGKRSISITSPYTIVVEALRGASSTGDIAVDDVSLIDGVCDAIPANDNDTTTTTTVLTASTPSETPTNPSTVSCTFDGGLCGWKQLTSDQTNWSLIQGNTLSSSTGPTNDHTTGNGKYIYLEASDGLYNYKAQLESNQMMPNGIYQCFQLWYHMHGSTINTLNVYIREQNKPLGSPIWTKEGEQGDKWILAKISISVTYPYTIVLEALKGKGFTGDIAVDDVSLVDDLCEDAVIG